MLSRIACIVFRLLAVLFIRPFRNLFAKQEQAELLPSSFLQLEQRRVLSVNGTFAGGVLTVDITAGGNTVANLLTDGAGNFFLDENNNNTLNGFEESGTLLSLRQVIVNGFTDAGNPAGTFNWRGNFSTSPLDLPAVDVIDINNVAVANFDSTSDINAQGNVNINATTTLLNGSLDVINGGSLTVTNTSTASSLGLSSTSNVNVANQIDISVGSLDQDAGATLTATNVVDIDVDTTATIDGTIQSTAGSIFIESLGSGITMGTTGELTADLGSVKMQATAAGADIVADAISAGRDILLRAGDDITLNAPITSDTGANAALFDGHIEINAGDLLTSSASVTAVDGSVFVRGTNIDLLDGGDLNSNLGLYVEAGGAISIASDINAQQAVLIRNGAFTLTATGSVIGANIAVQSSSFSLAGTIDAAAGVAVAAGSITMTGNALIDGTSVAMFANNDIALGRVVATNTNIFSDSGSITDNNGTTLNVQASTLSVTALQGSIGTSDLLGTPDLNPNAIDIQVGTLSSNARNGMYFQQSTGNLTIGSAPGVGAGAAPVFFRVPFIGPATTGFGNFGLSIGGSSDLTSTNGPIKVKVDAGTLTVTDGTDADGIGVTTSSGDILLWGENGVGVQARVVATNGDITFRSNGTVDITASGSLQAGDTGLILANSLTYSGTISATNGLAIQTVTDLTINSAVTSTNGSIALISTSGSVIQSLSLNSAADFYVGAAQNYTMAAGTTLTATGNAVIDVDGNANLRQVTAANIAINAGGNILDADEDVNANIIATTAILNALGSIGASNALVPPTTSNVKALDTRVGTLSSRSGAAGSYIQEIAAGGNLNIGQVNAIAANIAAVKEVKFNSSEPSVTLTGQNTTASAQEDAESLGVFKLVVSNGILALNDGPDADADAVTASGDILLNASSNINIDGNVSSTNGIISILSQADIVQSREVSANSGSVYIDGSTVNLLSTANITADQDILVNAVTSVTLTGDLRSTNGQIIVTGTPVTINALSSIEGVDVGIGSFGNLQLDGTLTATGKILLFTTQDLIMTGSATSSGDSVTVNTLGDARLGRLEGNRVSVLASNSILDNNAAAANIVANTASLFATNGTIGAPDAPSPSINNPSALDLQVGTLAARANGSIYLQELAAGGDLTVGGVAAETSSVAASANFVSFNSSPATPASSSISVNINALSDVQSTTGGVYMLVSGGALNVTDGADADSLGIQAPLEIRIRTTGDIDVSAEINGGNRVSALSTTGSIFVNDGVISNGSNLLDAARDVVIANEVRSNGGDITIYAADDIAINYTATTAVDSAGGSILLLSQNGLNTGNDGIIMASGSSIAGGTGQVILAAFDSGIQLARVSGSVVGLLAANAITDANDDVTPNTLNIVANAAVLQTGSIGAPDTGNVNPNANTNAIDTQIGTLAASSVGAVYIREVDGLTINSVAASAVRVNQTGGNGFASISLSNVFSSGGAIKLQSVTGDIVIDASVVTLGSSDVLLETLAPNGDIVVNQVVSSRGGDVNLRAGDDIDLNANVSTTGTGSIHLLAANNTVDGLSGVDMAASTTVSTPGNVRIAALNGGDILLSRVNGASVSLNAANNIIDNNDGVTPNTLNVQANNLQMVATNGRIGNSDIGNPIAENNTAAIDTQVTTLAARSSTGMYVREVDGVTVDSVSTSISNVFFNSTESPVVDTLEDLVTISSGPIKLQSVTGNITVNAGSLGGSGVSSAGSNVVLLQTLANSGDIVINGEVTAGSSSINLRAGDDVDLNANVSQTGGSTIHIQALNNNADANSGVDMAANTVVSGGNGTVRIDAQNGGSILLSRVNAARVSLVAGQDILDNNGNVLNVQANILRMTAGGAIGGSQLANANADLNDNAIDTQIATLAAEATAGIYIEEADGVTVDNTGSITVFDLDFRSTINPVPDAALSDLTTTTGPIKVKTNSGTLTITDGADADAIGVTSGSGDILLWGENGLAVQARVTSNTGDITFRSASDITVSPTGSLETTATGYITGNSVTLDGLVSANEGLLVQSTNDLTLNAAVQSSAGAIGLISSAGSINQNVSLAPAADFFARAAQNYTMAAGTSVTATGDDLVINAGGNINLRLVEAANVALTAGGNILDADVDQSANIRAANAILNATGSIGANDALNGNASLNVNALDLEVGTISTRSGAGGTYLQELAAGGALAVGPVAAIGATVNVRQARFRSTDETVSLAGQPTSVNAQEGAESLGAFKTHVDSGDLTISNGSTVRAGQDILLRAGGVDGDVTLSGEVVSTAGHITVQSSDDIVLQANVTTGSSGTIYLDASGDVAMDKLATISTANQDVLVRAAQDFRLGIVNAGTADVALEAGGSILDAQRFLAADAAAGQNQVTLLNATGLQVGDTIILDDIDSATQTLTITGIAGNVLTLSGNLTDAYSVAQSAILEDTRDVTQVLANQLKMVATGGSIGQADPAAAATANNNSINTQVNTLAATSASGIYISETNGVTVANVDAVTVTQANFNSTTSAVAATGSEDLITTANGPIKLQTTAGTLALILERMQLSESRLMALVMCFCRP